MLTLKLLRLIEKHSEELVGGLTEQIHRLERTSDFRKIPAAELELAAAEVYRNLGEWLLQKTDKDIETRFRAIGARRAAEGVGLHQFVWALITSRDHLWHFLRPRGARFLEPTLCPSSTCGVAVLVAFLSLAVPGPVFAIGTYPKSRSRVVISKPQLESLT